MCAAVSICPVAVDVEVDVAVDVAVDVDHMIAVEVAQQQRACSSRWQPAAAATATAVVATRNRVRMVTAQIGEMLGDSYTLCVCRHQGLLHLKTLQAKLFRRQSLGVQYLKVPNVRRVKSHMPLVSQGHLSHAESVLLIC